MPRIFIGVMLPDEVRREITDFQASLIRMPMKIKLVEPENLHFSLSFIGETSSERLADIKAGLEEVCGGHRSFTVRVGSGMLIPNESHVRVIALGVRSSLDELEDLRKDIVKRVGGESHPVHLTLGRVRKIYDRRLVTDAVKSCPVEKYFEVGFVSIIRSVLSGRGPKYETLESFELG